jgi:hypothetical protein
MNQAPHSKIVRIEVSGQQTAGRVNMLEPGWNSGWSERERGAIFAARIDDGNEDFLDEDWQRES